MATVGFKGLICYPVFVYSQWSGGNNLYTWTERLMAQLHSKCFK